MVLYYNWNKCLKLCAIWFNGGQWYPITNQSLYGSATTLKKKNVIYRTVLPFQETKPRNYHSHTLLSALRKRIITHRPLARSMTGEKNTRLPTFISSGTFLDRESILPTSINTRSRRDNWITKSSSTTWEKSINGTIVRAESESDKRRQKKSHDTIFPVASRTSNLYPTRALRLFTPRVSLFRRAFRVDRENRASRAPPEIATRVCKHGYVQGNFQFPFSLRLSEHRQIR